MIHLWWMDAYKHQEIGVIFFFVLIENYYSRRRARGRETRLQEKISHAPRAYRRR